MAEPQAVPGVLVPACLDVGDAVLVAADRYWLVDAGDLQRPLGDRQPATEQQTEDQLG